MGFRKVLFVLAASVCLHSGIFAAPRDVQIRSINLTTGVVELFNFNAADVQDLSGFQFCTQDDNETLRYSATTGFNGRVIMPMQSFFIHFNNDSPGGTNRIDLSDLTTPFGIFALPLDTGPYAMSFYFPPVNFNLGTSQADHVQWNIDGVDNNVADERADEAEGETWTDQSAWVVTTAETTEIVLTDTSGAEIQGPDDYQVIGGADEPDPRDVQIRSLDLINAVVELHNFGALDQDLSGWQLCTHDEDENIAYTDETGFNGVTIEAGTSLFIHYNNDGPGGPDNLNVSDLVSLGGSVATPIDSGPYSLQAYFPPVDFENGNTIADHLQWSIGGEHDLTAAERSDEAVAGGVWSGDTDWIVTNLNTTLVVLGDEQANVLHGPGDYVVTSSVPRETQIRSVNFDTGVVELRNFGSVPQSLRGWQFCTHDETASLIYSLETALDAIVLDPGASLLVYTNNDSPGGPLDINVQDLGDFALPLDTGPYSLDIYFPIVNFDDGNTMADHLQWNLDGTNDVNAAGRAVEATTGGVWTAALDWIATALDTRLITLRDSTGAALHGPADYNVIGPDGLPFIRADSNADGGVNIADVSFVANFVFGVAPATAPPCRAGADANGDGNINIADPSFIANFVFGIGAATPPPAPHPNCGTSPGDPLPCDDSPGCTS